MKKQPKKIPLAHSLPAFWTLLVGNLPELEEPYGEINYSEMVDGCAM